MNIEFSKEEIIDTLELLKRVTLKGVEVPAYLNIISKFKKKDDEEKGGE